MTELNNKSQSIHEYHEGDTLSNLMGSCKSLKKEISAAYESLEHALFKRKTSKRLSILPTKSTLA